MPGAANVDALLAQCEWVRKLVRHLVFDKDVADDVVQQTYLAAIEHAPERMESPRSWLAQVARRFVFQAHRKETRRRRSEILAARAEALTAGPGVERRIEMHRSLVDAVGALPDPYRSLVVMRYFEGIAPREIARRYGLPETTVRNRLSRALDQLRTRLDSQYGDRRTWSVALLPLTLGRGAGGVTAGTVAAAAIAVVLAGATLVLVLGAAKERDGGQAQDAAGAFSSPRAEAGERADGAVATPPRPAESALEAPEHAAPVLRGRVVDGAGAPASGARVWLMRPLHKSAHADDWFTRSSRQFERTAPVAETAAGADGAWAFADPGAGPWDVLAEVPGAARGLVEGVAPAAEPRAVDLVVEPVELVTCVAIDDEGNPVPGVEVAVHHQKSFDPHFNRPRTEILRSDGAGRFTIAKARKDLVDARLLLVERFQGAGCWQQVSLRKPGFAPIYAAPLSEHPIDEEGRVVFVMQRGRRVTVSFRADEPIAEPIRCMLRMESARFEAVTTTDESQDAVFDDVPRGTTVSVVLDTPGWALIKNPVVDGMRSRFCASRWRVPATGDIRWEIVVHRGASVGGTVVDDLTGAPVEGVEVAAFPNASYLASMSHLVRAISDREGRFAIAGLTAIWNELRIRSDEWHAPAPPPGPGVVEAPETGLPPAAAPPVVATRPGARLALLLLPDGDEPIRDLRILVRRAGRASGTVVDERGAPVAGVRVSAAGDSAQPWPAAADESPPCAVTGADGRFTLAGVPPGTPRLVVRAPDCAPALSDPFALEPGGEGRVPPVVVRPGEPVVVVVRSDRGRPIPGIGVKIYASRFPREHVGEDDVAARTDAAGRVEVRSLPAGPLCLAVENQSPDGLVLSPAFRSTLAHDPARREEIAVEMVEPAVLSGSVRLADGTPVAHASVVLAPDRASPDDFQAIEDLLGRGPIDWGRAGAEAGVRELSGVRIRTDAAGAFSAKVNSRRPFVVRRVEQWRRGDRALGATFEPVEPGAALVPGGPAVTLVVQRSPGAPNPR
jgi:RNA polymerase sigma-70 factor (ECF subfamily)